jgi:hypothetical protein
MSKERKAWERQPGETSKAFKCFCFYKELGVERTVEKALAEGRKRGIKKGQKPSVWRKWSIQFRWVERCEAWDDYVEELAWKEIAAGRVEMARRQVAAGQFMQKLAATAFNRQAEELMKQVEGKAPHKIGLHYALKLQELGVKIERMAAGDPKGGEEGVQTVKVQLVLKDGSEIDL